jgi:hypothetical protein
MPDYVCAKTSHVTRWQVEGRVYDPVDTPDVRVDGRDFTPEAWAILCNRCGTVWARRTNMNLPNRNWQVKRWPCQSCDYGSLWDTWNEAWNRSLPKELLYREMDIIQRWYDEGIRTYAQFFQRKFFRRKV